VPSWTAAAAAAAAAVGCGLLMGQLCAFFSNIDKLSISWLHR
jgi:hypothetical protein